MRALTARQHVALATIRRLTAEGGRAPLISELAGALAIRPESAADVLRALEKKGAIRRARRVLRSIEVIAGAA